MIGDITIRGVEAGDAGAMLAIYAPMVLTSPVSFELEPPSLVGFAERVKDVSAGNTWLVAEKEGQVVGYAYETEFRARPAYEATRETTVYVHQDHQQHGLARLLMATLLDEVRESGAHTVIGVITLPNEASVRLHESLGYRHVGTFREVGRKFDAWHDVGFWQLHL